MHRIDKLKEAENIALTATSCLMELGKLNADGLSIDAATIIGNKLRRALNAIQEIPRVIDALADGY